MCNLGFPDQTVIKSKLNNLTLLRALDYSSEKNISRFYSDLELTFGDITTNAFLNSQLDTSQHIQHIHTSDWPEFKSICLKLTSRYKHRLTIQSVETLDREYHEIIKTTINTNKRSLNAFNIRINTNSLKRFFNKQKAWLKQQEKILNDENSTINDCKNTFVECHKLLKFINELVNHDLMNGVFKLERTIPAKIINNSSLRIRSPINKIFKTQLNIAILGDAGAGKTTCLQMQARQELEKGSNKLVLFIPLAQVIHHNADIFKPSENERSPKILIKLLVKFFHTEHVDLSDDELEKLLQNNESLLLFDGIDEVISKAPWILSSISLLSDLYPRSQIVISSRTGGKYLNNIKFLGLGLLPFTDKQRDYFITEWFDSKKDPRIKSIIDHVNNNTALKEIIKKPLLATIMCVLAEHDVPLPKNELRLYQERMKLLTGHYDLHKQINRTKSTQDLLEKVARKLAFALHQSQIRENHIDNLIQIAVHALTPEECTKTLVTQAVKELQHPCNVLLPTSHDHQLGFGLLRYQEYLVAQELLFNRSISLKQFYSSTWWKEVMVMFVKMSGDPDYILKDILSTGNITSSTDTFYAIIATLPHVEKMKYENLIIDAIKRERDMKQRSSSR